MHENQKPADRDREEPDKRPETRPAVGVDVVEIVTDVAQLIVFHRAGIQREAEGTGRADRHADAHVGCRRMFRSSGRRRGGDTTDAAAGAVERQQRGDEVLGLDGDPLEGPAQCLRLAWLEACKVGSFGIALLGDDRQRSMILVGVGLGIGQTRAHLEE